MNDGTMALAAAIATMKVYKKLNEKNEYKRLRQWGHRLSKTIEGAFKERGLPCHVNNLGPSLKIWLTDLEPNFEKYCNLDRHVVYLFLLSLMPDGVFLSVPSSGSIFLSFAHTEEDMQRIISAVNSSLDEYKFEDVLSEVPNFFG